MCFVFLKVCNTYYVSSLLLSHFPQPLNNSNATTYTRNKLRQNHVNDFKIHIETTSRAQDFSSLVIPAIPERVIHG